MIFYSYHLLEVGRVQLLIIYIAYFVFKSLNNEERGCTVIYGSPLVTFLHSQKEKLVGKGVTAVYIQDIQGDEQSEEIKKDELHKEKRITF